MIKITRANIPLLEKFLRKEVYTINRDVPIIMKDGQIVGWNDIEVVIKRGKKEIVAVAGEYISREIDKIRVYQPPKYTVNDYIIKGYRTYRLSDIPYSSLQELKEDIQEEGRNVIIDEFRKIICIK
jgi:hypothetical protein